MIIAVCIISIALLATCRVLYSSYCNPVSFNPTREDNYPIVNLEDQTCEAPIVTYETGGSKETLCSNTSRAVKDYQEGLSILLQRVSVS